MKFELGLAVRLDYLDEPTFRNLIALGTYKIIQLKNKKAALWFFKLKDISKVIQILGEVPEFEKEEIMLALEYCPPLKQEIKTRGWKGAGKFTIIEYPKIYVVKEYRKVKETGEIKEVIHKVAKEKVRVLWETISKYDIGKKVKTRKVARDYCVALHDTSFIVKGRFDFSKFFGTRTKYFEFYYGLKVLEEHGVIQHHSSGYIVRLAEEWAQVPEAVVK